MKGVIPGGLRFGGHCHESVTFREMGRSLPLQSATHYKGDWMFYFIKMQKTSDKEPIYSDAYASLELAMNDLEYHKNGEGRGNGKWKIEPHLIKKNTLRPPRGDEKPYVHVDEVVPEEDKVSI